MKLDGFMAKAIMAEIKETNANADYLVCYNKGIKLISIDQNTKHGENLFTTHHNEWDEEKKEYNRIDDIGMKLEVKCKFKPADKWENNIVIYEVVLYSDGSIRIFFDGTEYAA